MIRSDHRFGRSPGSADHRGLRITGVCGSPGSVDHRFCESPVLRITGSANHRVCRSPEPCGRVAASRSGPGRTEPQMLLKCVADCPPVRDFCARSRPLGREPPEFAELEVLAAHHCGSSVRKPVVVGRQPQVFTLFVAHCARVRIMETPRCAAARPTRLCAGAQVRNTERGARGRGATPLRGRKVRITERRVRAGGATRLCALAQVRITERGVRRRGRHVAARAHRCGSWRRRARSADTSLRDRTGTNHGTPRARGRRDTPLRAATS